MCLNSFFFIIVTQIKDMYILDGTGALYRSDDNLTTLVEIKNAPPHLKTIKRTFFNSEELLCVDNVDMLWLVDGNDVKEKVFVDVNVGDRIVTDIIGSGYFFMWEKGGLIHSFRRNKNVMKKMMNHTNVEDVRLRHQLLVVLTMGSCVSLYHVSNLDAPLCGYSVMYPYVMLRIALDVSGLMMFALTRSGKSATYQSLEYDNVRKQRTTRKSYKLGSVAKMLDGEMELFFDHDTERSVVQIDPFSVIRYGHKDMEGSPMEIECHEVVRGDDKVCIRVLMVDTYAIWVRIIGSDEVVRIDTLLDGQQTSYKLPYGFDLSCFCL